MDLKIVEAIEKEDPSEEILKLTTRWKEITKPGDYRYTQGQWKGYNPPRTLRAEQKKIEIELWQKKNKLLWRRMEGMSKETQEEIERKREFHRVIDKIRNIQKPNETEQGTSRHQTGEIQHDSEIPELDDAETMSSGSENAIAVPAISFKRYLGATGVRYINMGKTSKIQTSSRWDLEETVRQVAKIRYRFENHRGGNDQRREITQNTGMHRAKNNGTNTRRVQRIHKTFINEIRCRLL